MRELAPVGYYFDDEFKIRDKAYKRFRHLLTRQQREFTIQVEASLREDGGRRDPEAFAVAIEYATERYGPVDWRLELTVGHIMYSPQRAFLRWRRGVLACVR